MSSNPSTILCFGEILWDILPGGTVLGGAPFNVALRLHSLGNRSLMVSRLGRDELGRRAGDQLRDWGLTTDHIQWDDRRATGTVQVSLDAQGSSQFNIVPDVAYDFIELSAGLLDGAARAGCLCFGTLAQRTGDSRQTLRELLDASPESLKVLDLNLRKDCYSNEIIEESLKRADVLKLNLDEAHFLAELLEISSDSLSSFCATVIDECELTCCVVSLGQHGVFASTADGRRAYAPGYQIRVADTCGSGDALTAGFIHKFLRHRPLDECCEFGNQLGAIVATQTGATVPITDADVHAFRAASHPRIIEPALQSV